MNESSITPPQLNNTSLSTVAYTIYEDMLKSTKILDTSICTVCDKYVGINLKKPRNHFHGSDFGKCFRATQLDMNHPVTKNQNDYIKQMFLADGHLHEETLIKLLSHTYKITHLNTETELIKEVTLPGISSGERRGNTDRTKDSFTVRVILHTDGLLHYDVGGYKFIVECKSVKDWFWKNRLSITKGNPQVAIPLGYYGQCQAYMEAHNIPQTLLIFKNRHSSEISPPIVIEKNDEYITQRFGYLAGILYSTRKQDLVPKAYTDKKCDECVFCEYKELCWEK